MGFFGYEPVPGTLNVFVGRSIARLVASLPGGIRRAREDGRIDVYHEMVFGDGSAAQSGCVHVQAYRRTIEVYAPYYIRERFGLEDGDKVVLKWQYFGSDEDGPLGRSCSNSPKGT